jgi:hypothetical protein
MGQGVILLTLPSPEGEGEYVLKKSVLLKLIMVFLTK